MIQNIVYVILRFFLSKRVTEYEIAQYNIVDVKLTTYINFVYKDVTYKRFKYEAVGGGSVWRFFPSGKRCNSDYEIQFNTIYWRWDFLGKPTGVFK